MTIAGALFDAAIHAIIPALCIGGFVSDGSYGWAAAIFSGNVLMALLTIARKR